MRVVFCWTGISGYMSACWRALAAQPEIQLDVLCFDSQGNPNSPFKSEVADGFHCTQIAPQQAQNPAWVTRWVMDRKPDVIVIAGWGVRAYRLLAFEAALRKARFILGMDTPWRASVRQRLAPLLLHKFLRRMDRVVVSGERSWQYACRLGIPEARIRRGLYGIDYATISQASETRLGLSDGWPRQFLCIGRLEACKGIDTLITGYQRYRGTCNNPWGLTVCGAGPMKDEIASVPGVNYCGFLQPNQLPELWARSGAFVLASNYDPWPLVLVEACAAGLAIIHTEACGSAVELVRQYYNGLATATGNSEELARALRWIHHHPETLPLFGERSRELARGYSAESWACRWAEWLRELIPEDNSRNIAPS